MSAALPERFDAERLAAMSTALHSVGSRAVTELGRGILQQILIQGINGTVIVTHAGRQALLTVMVNNHAQLGFILLGIKKAAEKIVATGIAKPGPRAGLVYLGNQ